ENDGISSLSDIAYYTASYSLAPNGMEYYGSAYYLDDAFSPGFVETPAELWILWGATQYSYDGTGVGTNSRGFGMQRYNKSTLSPLGNPFFSALAADDLYRTSARAPDGKVWILGQTATEGLFYSRLSDTGQLINHRTIWATLPGGLVSPAWYRD